MARRRWNIEIIKQVMDGENPFTQVGYTGKEKQPKRKVGDVWTDSKGKTWKKTKDGKVSVNTQADSIRELVKPRCSVCKARIDFSCDKLDKKMHAKTGKCFDCLQVEEMVIRIDTVKWKAYEEKKLIKNKLGLLRDFKEKVIEAIEFLKNDNGVMGDVTSTGELVTYTGKSNPQWLIDAERDLIKANEEIKKMETEISNLEEIIK